MATTIYTAQLGAHYGYPQPPLSPPMDETSRCSLPSISNLLDMADGGSPTTEQSPASQRQPQIKTEARPDSSYTQEGQSRSALPPTPPMSSDASFSERGYNSPSMKSVSQMSAASAPAANYFYETTPPPMETDVHRQQMAAHAPRAYPPPTFAAPAFINQAPVNAYYPQMQPGPAPSQISGLFYQRPLPQTYPPLPVVPMAPASSAALPAWQHHHYISPSSAASFPQSQDRYICQTCNKAFSRPSSLRIHSHSHTGEKPFKCPHTGCGKAFSVRSNMKRHERGCHNFETGHPAMH